MANDKKITKTLLRLAEASRRRGHATFSAVPKDDLDLEEPRGYWQQIKERNWVSEFAERLYKDFGVEINEIKSNANDPPDVFASRNGCRVGIEVTELVKSQILEKIDLDRRGKQSYPLYEKICDQEWSRGDFERALRERITAKEKRASTLEKGFDILLIRSDEEGLTPSLVSDWLAVMRFSSTHIKEIYLQLMYWPNHGYPLFKLSPE